MDDQVTTDYFATHFNYTEEIWHVGSAGAVRFRSGSNNSVDARTIGFPTISQTLFAVRAVDDALFVGGAESLYECERDDLIGTPTLSGCVPANIVGTGSKKVIRGFAGDMRYDMFAVGYNESTTPAKPLLLVRSSKGVWMDRSPLVGSALYAITRFQGLTVVVGDNGTLLTRLDPP